MHRIFRLLQRHLEQQNPLCREYKNLRERMKAQGPIAKPFKLVLRDGETADGVQDQRFGRPSTREIASMIVEEGHEGREVVVEFRDKTGKETNFVRIPEYTRLFDPLHFVLLHTKGEFGWEYKRYPRVDRASLEQQEQQQELADLQNTACLEDPLHLEVDEDRVYGQDQEVYTLEPLDSDDPDDLDDSDELDVPDLLDGVDMELPDNSSSNGLKRKWVSMTEHAAFRLMIRPIDVALLQDARSQPSVLDDPSLDDPIDIISKRRKIGVGLSLDLTCDEDVSMCGDKYGLGGEYVESVMPESAIKDPNYSNDTGDNIDIQFDASNLTPKTMSRIATVCTGNEGQNTRHDTSTREEMESSPDSQDAPMLSENKTSEEGDPCAFPDSGSSDGDGSNSIHDIEDADAVASYLWMFDRLTQQYVVDQYLKVETTRLQFIRNNQDKLRTDLHNGFTGALANDPTATTAEVGKRTVLPSSFIGSPRHMYEQYRDAMAKVTTFGKPDLFLTMTCNPQWPEIRKNLGPHQSSSQRVDLCVRVFHSKLLELLYDIVKEHVLGQIKSYSFVVEFQKRSLPHVHLILFLADNDKLHTPEDIDSLIRAEIPDPENEPLLWETVTQSMLHRQCNDGGRHMCMRLSSSSPTTMTCRFKFPRAFNSETVLGNDSYPSYRRRCPEEGGRTFTLPNNGKIFDNRWVVPYNPYLLLKYSTTAT